MTATATGTETETELKIQLDPEAEARLRKHPVLTAMCAEPLQTRQLVTRYFDTPDHGLARHGIALRLRKAGRRWTQTVKKSPQKGSGGLFETIEFDRPAPGGRLNLDHDDGDGLYREIRALAQGEALEPVFETRVRRTAGQLRCERGVVELAIDRGEIIAGALSVPIREAELELVEGEVAAVFEIARKLFTAGPLHFSREPKSARGLRLATRGAVEEPVAPRKAGAVDYAPDGSVESTARDVLRDCFAQIAENMALLGTSEDPEATHQLRVGLRRLRTAFTIFASSLGKEPLQPLSDAARDLGREVGRLRDLDVLLDEIVAVAGSGGLDPSAHEALTSTLAAQRNAVRAEVRARLAAPESVAFLFDLGEFIETRGWLAPADYSQTGRLAAPVGAVALGVLDKRWRKVTKLGRDIEELGPESLHTLRKELKKLRYASEMFTPAFKGKRHAAFMNRLRSLQAMFGSLNDGAMAAETLSAPAGPGADNPAAQRAAGFVLGTLAADARADRPKLSKRWKKLAASGRFWA